MVTKQELHILVDALPESALAEAGATLERLADPLLLALLTAPEDDEPEDDEERAAVAEARAEFKRGEWEPWEEVRARLLKME